MEFLLSLLLFVLSSGVMVVASVVDVVVVVGVGDASLQDAPET